MTIKMKDLWLSVCRNKLLCLGIYSLLLFSAVSAAEPGDGVFKSHRGEWSVKKGTWQTRGEEPAGGWYLRSLKKYDMESLEFSVRKEKAGSYVYLYTDHWRVLLKDDKVIVKFAKGTEALRKYYRSWIWFWNGLERPIQFKPGTWNKFKFSLDGKSVKIDWNGRSIVDWSSPEQEWGERIRNSERVGMRDQFKFPTAFPEDSLSGKDQLVILHAYQTPVIFKEIRVVGKAVGSAPMATPQGFHTASYPQKMNSRYHSDSVHELIIPQGVVDVNWPAAGEHIARAAKLKAVEGWEISKEQMKDLGKQSALSGQGLEPEGLNIDKDPDYFVGETGDQKYPSSLWGPRGLPRRGHIHFNLADDGVYTLAIDSLRVADGPHPFEISVDGKVVSRVLYRRVGKEGFKDYVPLKLSKGPHTITLELLTTQVHLFSYLMRQQGLGLGAVSLKHGNVEPVEKVRADSKVDNLWKKFKIDKPMTGEKGGKVLRFQVTGLEKGRTYTLKPVWYEIGIRSGGQRSMEVLVNGKPIEKTLDVAAEAGWRKALTRSYKAAAVPLDREAGITFSLIGRKNLAFLNALSIEDETGKVVYAKTWATNTANLKKNIFASVRNSAAGPEMPGKWTEDMAFDGHNLVANPHLSMVDKETGKPSGWLSLKDLDERTTARVDEGYFYKIAPPELKAVWDRDKVLPTVINHYKILPGDGEYSHDPSEGRTSRDIKSKGALKITKTGKDFGVACNWPAIDFGKTQEFSFWVKAKGAAGTVSAELYWITQTMFGDKRWRVGGCAMPTPTMALIGKSVGAKTVTGSTKGNGGWVRLSVSAKPPYGAVFVIPVVRVENNTVGTVWIDDAEIDGYSAEPLEISRSLAGYHPKSDKTFVVKSKSKSKNPVTWELLSSAGKVLRSGEAIYHSTESFSRRIYRTVDLTDFETPGTYTLRVYQNKKTTVSTSPFVIGNETYRELCNVALMGAYNMRYNEEIDGVKDLESLDDCAAHLSFRDKRYTRLEQPIAVERRNALYGYYDAGDEYKKPFSWPSILLSAANMKISTGRNPLNLRSSDDAMDEIRWCLKTFQVWQNEDGVCPVTLYPPWQRQLENIPLFGHDRILEAQPHHVVGLSGAAAMAAWVTKREDRTLSKGLLEIALKHYNYQFSDEAEKRRESVYQRESRAARQYNLCDPERAELFARLGIEGKALLANLYLGKMTGEKKYMEKMEANVRHLSRALKTEAYRMKRMKWIDRKAGKFETYDASPYELYGSDFQTGLIQDFVFSLCRFIREYPRHALVPTAKEGLRRFAEDVERVSRISPYGQAYEMTTPKNAMPRRYAKTHYHQTYWMGLACSLAEIGMVLEDPEMIRLADRQLQWLLGKNVADASGLCGIGERQFGNGDAKFLKRGFMEGYLKGNSRHFAMKGPVPTMAFRNIGSGAANFKVKRGNAHSPYFGGVPKGYLSYWLQGDTPLSSHPSESYTTIHTPLIMAVGSVNQAMTWLEKEGR
ncbi:MAG: glycoside hydrolase family 9 protein [Planctomycetota bacterium]|jgi:hypothetical protein